MPRVRINRKRDMDKDLYSWIEGERKRRGMTQEDLGSELGLTQSAMSRRLKKRTLTTYNLICIFSLFNTNPEVISQLLKEKK